MRIIKYVCGGAVLLGGLFVLSNRGRTGHPGLEELKKWKYAHRGLHDEALPENSMAAFRAALEHGYGIELDIHLIKDGSLAVMHDTNLKRTTGCDGKITDLTAADLKNYHLGGTEETIPTFRQVLDLFDGKAPLIIELKADNNAGALVDAAVKIMEDYDGPWCMESFDPRCIYALKKKYPNVIRGQLSENYFAAPDNSLPACLKFVLKNHLQNFLTRPDFVAYKYADRKALTNFVCRKIWGIQGVSWTLKSQEEFDTAVKEGWIPIFEGFKP